MTTSTNGADDAADATADPGSDPGRAADQLSFPDGAVAVVSFDIDGTMQFGNPPGPVSVEIARSLAARGHVVGSASDRTRSDQAALWDEHGLEVSFVGGKHHLHEVRSRFAADHYLHIGDTDVDEHYARLAGFDFLWVTDLRRNGEPDLHFEGEKE